MKACCTQPASARRTRRRNLIAMTVLFLVVTGFALSGAYYYG